MGKSTIDGPFSIAMLVITRGYTESLSCQEFEHYDEDMQWLEESVEQAPAPGESMVSTWKCIANP